MSVRKERFCITCLRSEPILPVGTEFTISELKLCSRCKVVRYCSKRCQKSDFKKHKINCMTNKGNYDSQITQLVEKFPTMQWKIPPLENPNIMATIQIAVADSTWKIAEENQSWEAYQVLFFDHF
jgi:hypothetical protein